MVTAGRWRVAFRIKRHVEEINLRRTNMEETATGADGCGIDYCQLSQWVQFLTTVVDTDRFLPESDRHYD